MKLNKEIRDKIDNYFSNITPKQLCDIAVRKYGFTIDNDIDIENQPFIVISSVYYTSTNIGIKSDNNSTLPFAA